MAQIIDGKLLSQEMQASLAQEVTVLKEQGLVPGLAVVIVGEDPASEVYVRNKIRACEKVGIQSFHHALPADTSSELLIHLIEQLNLDPQVHGILVQLPLPEALKHLKVTELISPEKDVDGFHPMNVGRLVIGEPAFRSCTPFGMMKMLESIDYDLNGKHALVLGRSNIVGKPIGMMLLEKNATVTYCHSRTQDLAEKIKQADVLVAAVGRPRFVPGSWIKKGAVVLDVGINRLEDGKLVGDVDFESAKEVASYITPVPGGVGPMTITMLLWNTVQSAKRNLK